MTADAMWQVDQPAWPTFDIDTGQLWSVLDEFEEYWPVAVTSLADTPDAPDGVALSDQRQGEHE